MATKLERGTPAEMEHMALGLESCSDAVSGCKREYYIRWKSDINISLINVSSRIRNTAEVNDALNYISNIYRDHAGISVSVNNENPNAYIYFSDDSLLSRMINGEEAYPGWRFRESYRKFPGGCFGDVGAVDQEIVSVYIYVPSNVTSDGLASCLIEELFNASGLTNDPIGQPSLFASESIVTIPERFLRYMRVLYGLESW